MKYQIINGVILSKENAVIPTNDLAMLRGYGIFDYFRVLSGVPIFGADHIERLFRSMNILDLELEFERHHIKDMVNKLIEKNEARDAGVRIIVTGGYSEDGYTPSASNLYIMMHKLPQYDPSIFTNGVKIISTAYQRDIPGVKTTIYIQPIHFRKKMEKENASEVLYQWKGKLTECSRSNIFFVDQQNRVITPKNGLLKGITRKYVSQLATDKYRFEKRKVTMDEIPNMKEAFITSSTKGILPVTQIDDLTIGAGKPGAITMDLMEALRTLVKMQEERIF